MVPFLDTGLSTIFRLFNVEVALCVTTAAQRVAEFSTGELARKDRISDSDRISKIRARHGTRNEESYNYISGCNSVMSMVRRTSGPQKSGSRHPPRPRTRARTQSSLT